MDVVDELIGLASVAVPREWHGPQETMVRQLIHQYKFLSYENRIWANQRPQQ